MSRLDLILKDIKDDYSRENFFRIKKFFDRQPILKGEWVFFEIEMTQAADDFDFPHNLPFRPKDVLLTAITSGASVIFNYEAFTNTNLNFTVSGACTIRFFAGSADMS